ncbi:MAG: hypothetical protein QQN41_11230, partial [Nitrosopumilus sp.]
NKHYNTNITINITPSIDADSDTLTYFWFRNTSTDTFPNLVQSGTTLTSYTTNETADGVYWYFVNVSDGTVNVTGDMWNWTLDTEKPFLDPATNLTNNTFTNENLTVLVSMKDNIEPYNLTLRMWKGTENYHQNTSSTVVGLYINLTNLVLNVTEDGNYTIDINFSDATSESPRIDNKLGKDKKSETEYIFNDTYKSFRMLLRFEDKNENEINNPTDLSTYAEYNNKGTHINFGSNFTSNRNGLIPVYEINTENVNIDILNSGIKGHLVWFPYGTDFEGTLLVNGIEKEYTVLILRLSSTRVKVSIIPVIDLANGDVVEFRSESIFGLNVVDIFYILVIDRTNPIVTTLLNRTVNTNTTDILDNTDVNLTFFAGDVYMDVVNVSHNASNGIWVNESLTQDGNKTYHYVINKNNLTANEVVGWQLWIFDKANNHFGASPPPVNTFTVGASAIPPPPPAGDVGGTAGGFTAGAEAGAVAFAAQT